MKSVYGAINCTAIHSLKKGRKYASAHTAKEADKEKSECRIGEDDRDVIEEFFIIPPPLLYPAPLFSIFQTHA